MSLRRVHRDLLSRLSWRWPDPCYVVATRGGNRALIVTEATVSKSLTRLCAFNLETVNSCVRAEWIELGGMHRVPPYSGGKPGDSQAGQRVWLTPAGCVALGVQTPAQRQLATCGGHRATGDDQEAVRG